MAKVRKQTSPFEQSFMFHMIRDFFLLLVLVATVEMSIRYALVRYDFASKEQGRVDQAAQQLANDVKSIMLNSGGPLAARTVYPILNRNYEDLGLSIAVVPSEGVIKNDAKPCNRRAHSGLTQAQSLSRLGHILVLKHRVKHQQQVEVQRSYIHAVDIVYIKNRLAK